MESRHSSHLSKSPQQTAAYARLLARQLPQGAIVAFYGPLGSGKTTFIKALCQALNATPAAAVTSPTFTYLQIYQGEPTIYHFDLYRLAGGEQFLQLGFDEYLHTSGIVVIEWAERIADQFSTKQWQQVHLSHRGGTQRGITCAPPLEPSNR